ncbi:MAG: ParA family protein [Sphingomonadales bacterium]|nr:ParA family protein [Sphingomonadales bacterium]
MKTMMVHLRKGGVGKSTMAILYAWYQRKRGRRVLFVDFDTQCSSTRVLTRVDADCYPAYAARPVGSILDLTDAGFAERLFAGEHGPFDILTAVEDIMFEAADCDTIAASARALAASDAYDVAIFDTAPQLDAPVVALFQSADNLLIPMRPEDFSFDQVGVVLQLKAIGDQSRKVPLNIAGLVVNAMMPRETMRSVLALVERGHPDILVSTIVSANEPIRIAIDEAIPIFEQPSSYARQKRRELEQVFSEVDRRCAWPK